MALWHAWNFTSYQQHKLAICEGNPPVTRAFPSHRSNRYCSSPCCLYENSFLYTFNINIASLVSCHMTLFMTSFENMFAIFHMFKRIEFKRSPQIIKFLLIILRQPRLALLCCTRFVKQLDGTSALRYISVTGFIVQMMYNKQNNEYNKPTKSDYHSLKVVKDE